MLCVILSHRLVASASSSCHVPHWMVGCLTTSVSDQLLGRAANLQRDLLDALQFLLLLDQILELDVE